MIEARDIEVFYGASQALRDMLWPFEFTVTDNQSHGPVWIDVTALQPFEVHFQAVEKDAVQRVARDLGERWMRID